MPRITNEYITDDAPQIQVVSNDLTNPIITAVEGDYRDPFAYRVQFFTGTHIRCKCCGRSVYYLADDNTICDACKTLIAEEMFNPKNQNFTCNNVINMIKGKINAV